MTVIDINARRIQVSKANHRNARGAPKSVQLPPAAKPDFPPARDPDGNFYTTLTISHETCKWPIGDVGDESFCYCGHPPRHGQPYCGFHCIKAAAPVQPKRPSFNPREMAKAFGGGGGDSWACRSDTPKNSH
jgi:hypothetical protein